MSNPNNTTGANGLFQNLLTTDEIEKIVAASVRAGRLTTNEIAAVVSWANATRINHGLLKGLLGGQLGINAFSKGEPIFITLDQPEEKP